MSDYGNVPAEDVDAIQHAAAAAGRIAEHVPVTVPHTWRDLTYELVLDGILRDWVANGTNDLTAEDEEDLSNLVRVALDTAQAQDAERQDTAYRVILRQAVADWVENWNAED